ncbi:chorismate-binding protein [Candidatus Vidania fulgoroideorum]
MKICYLKKELKFKKSFLINFLNINRDFYIRNCKHKKYILIGYKFCKLLLLNSKLFINNTEIIVGKEDDYINMKKKTFFFFSYESSLFNKSLDNFPKIFLIKPLREIFIKNGKMKIYFSFKNNNIYKKKSIIELKNILNIFSLLYKKRKNKTNLFILKQKGLFYNSNFIEIKKLINNGEIMQVQLGKRLTIKKNFLDLSLLYRRLISYNIKEFSYLFKFSDIILFANSPEVFLNKNRNNVYMYPIAGTITRSKNIYIDKILERKLIFNKKELSEHNMLVDMTRNDILQLEEGNNHNEKINRKHILKLFFIQHITSCIKKNFNKFFFINYMRNLIPSGTLSGSPKKKAIRIISIIENFSRNFYGGVVGISLKNSIESAIFIRALMVYKYKMISIQSSSGIVKNSKLLYEIKEIENKLINILYVIKKI